MYSLPVTHLRRGEMAEVAQLIGVPEQVRRLEELGLRGGVSIEVVRGGSPCIVRVGGNKICFRDHESMRVIVTPRKSA